MSNGTKKPVSLQIDDGLEEITIINKYGKELGTFYFCPTDTTILARYERTAAMIEEALLPLQENAQQEQPEELSEDELKAIGSNMRKATEKICAAFDYLFGGNVAEAFFSSCSPLTLTNGSFYCENVVEAIGKRIAQRVQEETGAVNKRIAKYTHGYRTGKHAAGKK